MASADQLKALVKSFTNRDEGQFYSVALQVAAHEAKVGHGKLAEELRDLIDKAKTRGIQSNLGNVVSLSKPRGELAGLLQVSHPKCRLADMVLGTTALDQLNRVLDEHTHNARIREYGLTPRRKLLLVGPPGTGKTLTASVLATELGLPLFSVRLDSLITKYMGETASKLRQVFDAMNDIRGVYFFDEFDAIGSQRGNENDVGEIRRVLNSFLQMLEHDQSHSLIVAATNHPELLDYALFRRFDDIVEYKLPTPEQALNLLRSRLGSFIPKYLSSKSLMSSIQGLSFAELRRSVDETIKQAVMLEQATATIDVLKKALGDRKLLSENYKKK
jgi:SpoVK/Ycf46/Vps4 family AAA+-type ATPase